MSRVYLSSEVNHIQPVELFNPTMLTTQDPEIIARAKKDFDRYNSASKFLYDTKIALLTEYKYTPRTIELFFQVRTESIKPLMKKGYTPKGVAMLIHKSGKIEPFEIYTQSNDVSALDDHDLEDLANNSVIDYTKYSMLTINYLVDYANSWEKSQLVTLPITDWLSGKIASGYKDGWTPSDTGFEILTSAHDDKVDPYYELLGGKATDQLESEMLDNGEL